MATKKQACLYIALLLTSSWAIQILAILITGDINSEAARIWLIGTMMTPLVVTVFFLERNKDLKQKILWKPDSAIFITSFFCSARSHNYCICGFNKSSEIKLWAI